MYHDPEWVQDAIFYQIFPDRFANGDPRNDPPGVQQWGSPPTRENFCGGDLQGILDHLDYLKELDVTALYLTPIFRARSNHKYDTCDYLEIDPAFGDLALLRKLVAECHERDIRVVLDAVFNHCGDGFWAFEDLAQKGAASVYTDWFFPTEFPLQADPPNYQTCGGAAFLPKLNLANRETRDYLLKVARYWIKEAGIDGWRLDVPWKAPHDFWQEFQHVVKEANSEAYIVAEEWRDPAPWLAGDTCDGTMNYPLREAILDFCVRDTQDAEDFDHVTRRLREIQGKRAVLQLNLLGSHDTPRLMTLCQGNMKRAALAAVAQFTAVGVPMIYYGDEVGLTGGNDPGCRACMPWQEQEWNRDLRALYRRLARIRMVYPALRSESLTPLMTFNGVYAYVRSSNVEDVIVVLNPRQAQRDMVIPVPGQIATASMWRDVLSGAIITRDSSGLWIERLPEKTALLLVPEINREAVTHGTN
jgi:cyclomaltodextrinase / maltogenic alpha-amylase / neopullulanase